MACVEERDVDINEPRYSGPGKSGICVCGHAWHEHHLGMIMRSDIAEARGEAYVAQECEAYGSNECGGMMPEGDTWVHHCSSYEDRGI